jgi:hypothetical protein
MSKIRRIKNHTHWLQRTQKIKLLIAASSAPQRANILFAKLYGIHSSAA